MQFQEQSTSDIWRCICSVVRRALSEGNISPSEVHGIGFDATCSLCLFSTETDEPISVTGPDFDTDQNVILWLDHRAVKETDIINATGNKVLRYVGGKMSLEMEIPKILWLRNNMPKETFEKCQFYDLVDALSHIATGDNARSFSSMVCKQGYLPKGVEGSVKGWQEGFLQEIGLGDLADHGFNRIGGVNGEVSQIHIQQAYAQNKKLTMGFNMQNGRHLSAGELSGVLCEKAANELGLRPGIAIGSGVIDAYAGWIGTVGAKVDLRSETGIANSDQALNGRIEAFTRLAVVAGTSSCHIAMSPNPIFVPGVWGPYRDTIFPGCWMAEGGQSATGQLLKHVLESHPTFKQASASADGRGMNIFEFLNTRLTELAAERELPCVADLARYFFFYGDLFGNRSPLADSKMTGSLVGLSSDTSIDGLAIHYYGALEFIALQTKQIVDSMNDSGHQINLIFMSGSQCQNDVLVNLIASACNMPVVIPRYIHAAVCHGAAMLGAKAASADPQGNTVDLWDVIDAMSKSGEAFYPIEDEHQRVLLAAKYQVFLDQCQRQREYRAIVDRATTSR